MLFWNRSNASLSELLKQTQANLPAGLYNAVADVFWEDISKLLQKTPFGKTDEVQELLKEALVELTAMLYDKQDQWTVWKKKDIDGLLPNLIQATKWKLQIKGYRYSEVATSTLAKDGLRVLRAVDDTLLQFKFDKQKSQRRNLAKKHLHTPGDSNEVTERALRCVVTCLRYPEKIRQPIFAWNKNNELKLRKSVVEKFLYEQLALFAHMAKNDSEALPIDELELKLRRYIENRIGGEEKDQISSDIIQNTFLAFLDNKNAYRQKTFYVDKSLSSYLIDIVRNRKEIRKYHKEEGLRNRDVFIDDFGENDDDESLSDILGILKECVKNQGDNCRKLIETRYYGNYAEVLSYDAVASLLNSVPRTIENRGPVCNGLLRDCVMQKSNIQGLRYF